LEINKFFVYRVEKSNHMTVHNTRDTIIIGERIGVEASDGERVWEVPS
jgi:hypothetical protein